MYGFVCLKMSDLPTKKPVEKGEKQSEAQKKSLREARVLADLLEKGLLHEGIDVDPRLLQENDDTTDAMPKDMVRKTESHLGTDTHTHTFWHAFNTGQTDLQEQDARLRQKPSGSSDSAEGKPRTSSKTATKDENA